MFNSLKLDNDNINILKKLNLARNEFNRLNKDFFNFYNKLNFIQKYFVRKKVNLLKYNGEYIGFIWIKCIKKQIYSIQSMQVIPNKNLVECYKKLLRDLKTKATFSYECESNGKNINVLKEVGFKKMDGTLEMCCLLNDNFNFEFGEFITIDKLVKKRDEKQRCEVQNEIFKKEGRIPLSVEDIYFDEAQDYYCNDACFFIKYKEISIGYGQIIIDNQRPIIVNFGIIDNYRGKGLGKKFLLYLLKWAQDNNYKHIFIKVDYANKIAYNLYKSVGFKLEKETYKWEIAF